MNQKNTAPPDGAVHHRESKSAQIMEVIVLKIAVGKGTEEDPKRVITEYWSKDGKLLATNDPISMTSGHYPSLG